MAKRVDYDSRIDFRKPVWRSTATHWKIREAVYNRKIENSREGRTADLIAFNDVGDQLAALSANAPLSVTGQAEISAWIGKDGNPAAGLSLTIEEMIGLKQKSSKKRSTATVFNDSVEDVAA